MVQLLQQVRQDRICQGYEPPEHGACLLGTQEIQAFPPQAHSQGFHLAARDSEQRAQSILSLAERSDTKIMSMYKELSVKSRVRGDFHARFCERVRVKLPRSTRPCPTQGTAVMFIGSGEPVPPTLPTPACSIATRPGAAGISIFHHISLFRGFLSHPR